MKRITLLLLLACTFAPILNVQAKNVSIHQKKEKSVKSPKIGFYVFIKKCGDVSELKTQSLADVYMFIESFYKNSCFDIEIELEHSPYFRYIALEKEIYVEKMIVHNRGKYKRLKK